MELKFEDCLVPRGNLLGKVGDGMSVALGTLEVFRVSVGAAAVGIAQTAFDAALDYAKNRVQFGRPISGFQGTQFKLADMATELDAARALVYRAALLQDAKGENRTGRPPWPRCMRRKPPSASSTRASRSTEESG